MTTANKDEMIHQGRNIKRFREMRGLKQDVLASELGEDWNQKKISLLEQKEEVEPEILERVATILKVPVDLIKEFDEQSPVAFYNTFHDHSVSHAIGNYDTYNFNPVDEWRNAIQEIKRLQEENKRLYERMIKDKTDLIEKLEQMLLLKK